MYNAASVKHYLRMITSQNLLKQIVNITFKKIAPISSLPLLFTEPVLFIFVSISEQKILSF